LLPNSELQHSVLQRLGLLDSVKPLLPVAVLCPGAEFGSAKQWPWHHWQSMAERLVKQGYSVWFMGTSKERDGAEAIARILPEVKVLCAQTVLGEAIDLMALASVVVANDSGLLHIAAALGRPVIGLYGSTPSEYAPPMERWQGQAHVFELTLACRPCRQRECPLGHRACLENILPERVEEKILSMK
jgi:heptosyltransferase-2